MAAADPLTQQIEVLYRARIGGFYRVASAIVRDRDLAWDAVQEGFADAVRGRAGFRGEAPLEAWVWRLVVNAALRSQRRPPPVPLPDGFECVVSQNGNGPDVRNAVAALPERQRLAVFLRYYADLDYRAIADVLGVEVGTVSATLHAALSALRETMEVQR